MQRKILSAAVGLSMCTVPVSVSHAQHAPTYIERSGLSLTCYARHRATGQVVPVIGTNGHAGGYWGFATYQPNGYPVIIFDARVLSSFPDVVARFIYYHECAHLKYETTNEIEASCWGLRDMRSDGNVSPAEEQTLARVHHSIGRLEPKYGGSGQRHWDLTTNCANGN